MLKNPSMILSVYIVMMMIYCPLLIKNRVWGRMIIHHYHTTNCVASFIYPKKIRRTSSLSNCRRNDYQSKSILAAVLPHGPFSSSSSSDHSSNNIPHDSVSYIPMALAALRKAARYAFHLQPEYPSISANDPNHNDTIIAKKQIQNQNFTFTKVDTSPVTIADFGVQALVLHSLKKSLELQQEQQIHGNDTTSSVSASFTFIAEEGSDMLRQNPSLADDILHLIHTIPGCCDGISRIQTLDDLFSSIDLGNLSYDSQTGHVVSSISSSSNKKERSFTWCLDPIDGTKGFLRGKKQGGQYCIALALIEKDIPVLGFLVCPNLPVDANDRQFAWKEEEEDCTKHHDRKPSSRGCIFVAYKNGGCYQLPLFPPTTTATISNTYDSDASTEGAIRIHVTPNDGIIYPLHQVRFSIAVERGFGDPLGQGLDMARYIHGTLHPSTGDILYCDRLDSQAKYGLLARGSSQVFFRLPKRESVEWIWDHAPGKIIVEEAGGIQTDTYGNPISYGYGARMDPQVEGVLASCGGVIHQGLLKAYQETKRNLN